MGWASSIFSVAEDNIKKAEKRLLDAQEAYEKIPAWRIIKWFFAELEVDRLRKEYHQAVREERELWM